MNKLLGAAAAASTAAGAAAWCVRGRASSAFGPNIWHGPRDRPAIALTFDDGPAQGTDSIFRVLEQYGVPATFFQCGKNVEALPRITREAADRGHEIGNHSYTHPLFALKNVNFIRSEMERAQTAIGSVTGIAPSLFRAPYGVRWFGLRDLPLAGVMWDVIGLDWKLDSAAIADRLLKRTRNGSILCLHDGRELNRAAPIGATLQAVRWVVPRLLDRGFEFRTVSHLCQRMN